MRVFVTGGKKGTAPCIGEEMGLEKTHTTNYKGFISFFLQHT